jgi:Clp amino terminal domain, pathogenicity island component
MEVPCEEMLYGELWAASAATRTRRGEPAAAASNNSLTIPWRQGTVDDAVSEPSLDALITAVERTASADAPLDRLLSAHGLADALRARSDELLDQFVDAARAAECSWSEIGCTLGVTKQAAQQRYVALSAPARGDLPSGLRGPAAGVFLAAGAAAREYGHHYLRPEHLVLGLLSQPDELAGRALAELGVTSEAARARLVDRLGSTPAAA